MERRREVLARLIEGATVAGVADALRVSRQRVHEDVSYLVEVGALRRLSPLRARLRVEAGPMAARFLQPPQEAASGDRRERSALPLRLHHWRWSRRFTSGPRVEPPWTGERVASGVPSFWLTFDFDAGAGRREGWLVREYRGKARRSLQTCAPPRVVAGSEELAEVKAGTEALALAVLARFAERYGYALSGALTQSAPVEYAGPVVPGLVPFGVPGVTRAWADESPGDGRVEVETREHVLAAAWTDLPRWEAEVERRLAALEGAALRAVQRDARILTVIEGKESA